jgi:hypothetical protein
MLQGSKGKKRAAPGKKRGSDLNPQNSRARARSRLIGLLQFRVQALQKEKERKERQRARKIFPRNLTAQTAYLVDGNPVISRPEDSVANCFPGLEADIRNLDRRFFPGLVFEFISDGVKLAYVDALQDPDLQSDDKPAKTLYRILTSEDTTKLLSEGSWYIDWIEQKKKRIAMYWGRNEPLEDVYAWRIVRSLERGPVTIRLKLRQGKQKKKPASKQGKRTKSITLKGWRRVYTDPETGVINLAYQPGELGQGLCSPWQHDFRDCQCFYWAANHPDVVLGELYPGESLLPEDDFNLPASADGEDPPVQGERILASIPLDWLRADRSRAMAAEARESIAMNRPYQLNHFEINSAWQELSIVVDGREVGGLYVPPSIETANPLSSTEELAKQLRDNLAPLELTLIFEYLYARFSLVDEVEAQNTPLLGGAVRLARDRLTLIVASEMQHLRWVNQLLWDLFQDNKIPSFKPVLTVKDEVPTSAAASPPPRRSRLAQPSKQAAQARTTQTVKDFEAFTDMERRGDSGSRQTRPAQLRPLTKEVIDEFVAVEHPSGYIDGAYAQVIATLKQGQFEKKSMPELAMRIANDGGQHEIRFLEIKAALSPFFPEDPTRQHPVYLRKVTVAKTADALATAEPARKLLKAIKENLTAAYILSGNNEIERSGEYIAKARAAMTGLLDVGEELAKEGIGIPFFDFWKRLP